MRIAFVINAMGRGGAEIQVKDYATRLARRGHQVLLVSLLEFEDFEQELRESGVQTATLSMQKGRGSAIALARLARLLRQFGAEVIHAHMFAGIMAARAARACLTPATLMGAKPPVLIGTAHTSSEKKKYRYLAYRATDRFSDLWTCVSQAGLEAHERHHAIRRGTGLRTDNGIDTKMFAPNAELRERKRRELGVGDGFLWFTAGSFRNEEKDYSNLLGAFARIAPTKHDMQLVVAGEGRLFDEKRAEAERLGIGAQVRFLGLRSDITELLNAADAFVLASASEAMPIVLLEAAASALPIVCTKVGQTSDIVIEGTGLVVPPKDPKALADAMLKLVSASETDRRKMGELARAHVATKFDIDRLVDTWEQRYLDLLQSRA